MNKQPLSLAVVGHTNTGKTSLLRTLLRDSGFGEVRNAPSTTRHVEEAAISDGADMLVFLYDTPGLEDAGGVLEWLENHTDNRSDGIERLQQFLGSHGAHHDFNQRSQSAAAGFAKRYGNVRHRRARTRPRQISG